MTKISVIIPVYNVENYLKECLDSIVKQTFKDIEIICVNDGSTDNSLNIINEYSKNDSRIKVITQENKGLSGARNTGLNIATGEYIYFVDSDDYLNENTLEIMYKKLIDNNVDMVATFAELFYSEEKPDNFDEFNESYVAQLSEGIYTNDKFLRINSVAWGKLYKKDIIKKYNLSFDEGLVNEDESWQWYYATKIKNFYYLPEKLYKYRIRQNSIMQNKKDFSDKNTHIFRILENIDKHLKEHNLYDIYKKPFKKYFLGACYSVINRTAPEHQEKMLELAKSCSKTCNIKFNKGGYYSFGEHLFSIKNSITKKEKIISILGIKLSLKKKK